MTIDVSCIIITHDRDPLLREALASVLAQDLREGVEIVVVDDMDSASARKVVEELAGSLYGSVIRYVVAQTDPKGASASRNAGAHAARGQVLAFLDDDDLWEPTYLSDAVDRLGDYEADFVVTWMTVLERDGQTAPLLRMPEGLKAAECVARNRGMTGSNVVLTRSAFDAVGGFDEHLRVSNDKDLLVRLLAEAMEYRVVPLYNAVHRRHAGPQLTRMDEKRAVGILAYLNKHRDIASLSDKRAIMKTVHGIRRRSAPTRSSRLVHLTLFLLYQSPQDVLARVLRRPARDGSYKSA
jgi:glycosyltransferase involved in cell wall biosynthesis